MSALLTGQTLSSLRNDYPDRVGLAFTVGAASITIAALGRWIVAGNTQSRQLVLVDAVSKVDLATVALATAGQTAGAYAYATLSTPVVCSAGSTYYIFSAESTDYWYDAMAVTCDARLASVHAAYRAGGSGAGSDYELGGTNQSYVPVNALIQDASPLLFLRRRRAS